MRFGGITALARSFRFEINTMLNHALACLMLLLAGVSLAGAQGFQLDTRPIVIDNHDGCGNKRAAVQAGRDAIQRDRFYKESDVWFQNRVAELDRCVREAPARRDAAISARRSWEQNTAQQVATANTVLIWTLGLGLPLAVLLSYAQSAGIAGNGARVRLKDWKGTPVFIWSALATAAVLFAVMSQTRSSVGYDRHAGLELIGIASGFAMLAALGVAAMLTFQFIREGLWSTLKGLAILAHYVLARHPAQAYLPTTPTEALSRRDFKRAMREHGLGLKSFWTELMTPSFVRRHKIERALQVEAQLKADTAILKSAIERESTRAAYRDGRSEG